MKDSGKNVLALGKGRQLKHYIAKATHTARGFEGIRNKRLL